MSTARTTSTNERARRERERAALDLWSELTNLSGRVRARLAAHLEVETGLQPDEADLLALLEEAPEQRARMGDVSVALGLSKSGVTRIVDRLEARGLVVRAPCPTDRRVTYAGLTEAGGAAARAAIPARAAGLARFLTGRLSAEEVEGVAKSVRRLTQAAGAPPSARDG